MISRRHLHLLIALLLPLMVVRGMLPAGYMPITEGGVLKMALCSDGLRQPGSNPATPAPADHSGSPACPFALAAGLAPPSDIGTAVPAPAVSLQFLPLPDAQRQPTAAPARHLGARGPPTLS